MRILGALAIAACLHGQRLVETVDLGSLNSTRTTRPVIRGTEYAVSSMEPLASQTAERIMRDGGNAFDAIVGGQAVLGLVAPASNGIGGDAVLLVWDAKAGKAWSVNAEGTAPKLATIDWYNKNRDGKLPVNDTLLSATVPGVIDAWYILLSRWGTKSFGEVLGTAIALAENGFPAPESLASSARGRDLAKYETSRRLYQGGNQPTAGRLWRNRDLARTLRRLVEAEKGAASQGRLAALKAARDRFYKGDIAREMGAFSEANGGLFRYDDFASYTAKVEETVSIGYRGYTVHKNPSANQGPAELFALNVLEGYDLKKLGHNSTAYIHANVEAIKLAMADRDHYLGDDDFVKIPWSGLLSKDYASRRRTLIDPDRANGDFRPGKPDGGGDRPRDLQLSGEGDHEGDTSYIATADRARNAISFTPSLHSGFGAKIMMADLGFSFNCRGDYYSLTPGHANALEPGKRPRSTLQGTLVTRDGKPFLVTGSPGGDDQCMRTMQTFLNVVEFGMNIQQAIEAPRWTTRSFPSSPFPHTMYPNDIGVESRIPVATRAELVRKGHKMTVHGPWSMGSNGAILIDTESGVLHAGADPRVNAYAIAW